MSDSFADRDRIVLAGLAFYGYHGIMPEESKLGQRFRVDLEIGFDMTEAGRTDEVEATVSYADIYNLIEKAFSEKRFKLIEALGYHLIARLFETFERIEWVRVRVRKPEAPLPIVAGEAAIEILRRKEDI
ncbi:dihydroneopterin aldolase [Pelagibacterium xiamenense]|uniref:dihydroneopterin aldolase n=1 Tax=Pelagibacterium xiamenense TaxID=2901140 RepID=UPI001E57644A|nr:dihydroneopterin aldolase [Pelagibacterium xiamenense]MCD7061196.1 dihydroneopterin aldolase [Pelagibacterium xiamenense]